MEFTKAEQKVLDAYRRLENMSAYNRVAAYIVLSPDRNSHGIIRVYYPKDGTGKLHVFVWQCKNVGIQYGCASGYGYDKLSNVLAGMMFDGIRFTDHPVNWETQLREAGYQIIRAI